MTAARSGRSWDVYCLSPIVTVLPCNACRNAVRAAARSSSVHAIPPTCRGRYVTRKVILGILRKQDFYAAGTPKRRAAVGRLILEGDGMPNAGAGAGELEAFLPESAAGVEVAVCEAPQEQNDRICPLRITPASHL